MVRRMTPSHPGPAAKHEHTVVTIHRLEQRGGVPYEVERTTCSECRRVLRDRPVRRAVAS